MGRRPAPIALVVMLLAFAALPQTASALCTEIDHHVTTTADTNDPSDGVLSVREAVGEANADTTPSHCHVVLLPDGHYTLSSALAVTSLSVEIQPESPTATPRDVVIDGGGTTTLASVGNGATADFSRVTLEDAPTAIVNAGQTDITRSSIVDNHGATGGAIWNKSGANLHVETSTFARNSTSGKGAAGGAILNEGAALLVLSTLSGNSALGGLPRGGAIYNAGSLTLSDVTMDRNTLSNVLLASGPDVYTDMGATTDAGSSLFGSGCNAIVTTDGSNFNLDADGTCAGFGEDLHLGPLEDNGGGTDTEMLLAGSPAIDARASCTFGQDQRLVAVPQGPKCDVGAYELVETGDVGVATDTPSVSLAQGATAALLFRVANSASPLLPSFVNDAVHPVLTDVLPAGLSFAGGSPGCAASGQTVTCDLGPVVTGSPSVPVTIDVRADAAGTFQDAVDVGSARLDTNPLDDHATISITSTAQPEPVPIQPSPAGSAAAKVAFAGKAKVTGDRVRFTLACSGAACSGDARILAKERVRHHRVVAVVAKTVSLGKKAFSIPAGQRRTITLRLSASGRKLRKRFRLPARLSIRLGTPKTTAASAAIVFKRRR